MRAFVVALLVLSAAAFQVKDLGVSRMPSSSALAVDGPYDQCIALLEKILLEANEIAQHIMSKEWQKVVPLAIKLSKDIYDDIVCFQHPHSQVRELQNDPYECVVKHIKAAAEAIQHAVDSANAGDYKEAIRQVLIAIAHIHEAQQCDK